MAGAGAEGYILNQISRLVPITESVIKYHIILNHRDVPKDATIGSYLRGEDAKKIQEIVKTLYYIEPACGVCTPGTKGKNHVIEKIFLKDPELRPRLTSPKQFPRQSAHGISLNIELGLKYIFTDAGKLPKDYLGDGAESVTYASPTNMIDSASINTTKMISKLLKSQVIADEATLKQFGIRLTKKIEMYDFKNRAETEGILTQLLTTKDLPLRKTIIGHITSPNTIFCITFELNNIPGVGLPFGNTIFMFYDKDHYELPVEGYIPEILQKFGMVFAMGNDKKNELLHTIFAESLTDPISTFLKYFIIEIKLLGDANHAIFSKRLVQEAKAEAEAEAEVGGGGEAAEAGGMKEESQATIAIGTPDYDVVLRFVLEGLNVFYTTGACILYYPATPYNPVNDIKRVVQTNRNTIEIIKKFKRDLDRGEVDIKGYGDITTTKKVNSLKLYITSLLKNYDSITNELDNITGNINLDTLKRNLLRYTLVSPVILMPRPSKSWYWKVDTLYYEKFLSYMTNILADQATADGKVNTMLEGLGIREGSTMSDFSAPATASSSSSSSSATQENNYSRLLILGELSVEAIKQKDRKYLEELSAAAIGEASTPLASVGGGGEMLQGGGGSITNLKYSLYPEFLTPIILTEFRDILKFAWVVYICFGINDVNIAKFFHIVFNNDVLEELLSLLTYGKEEEVNVKNNGRKPGGKSSRSSGGGGNGSSGGGGNGSSDGGSYKKFKSAGRAIHIETKPYKIFFDTILFKICKYALIGVMYYKDTLNRHITECNPERLDKLLKVILSILNMEATYNSDTDEAKTARNIFESLRKDDMILNDLTIILNTKLVESNALCHENSRGYNEILEMIMTQGQSGGSRYITDITDIYSGKNFELTNLDNSLVPELLHYFSHLENILTIVDMRLKISPIDAINKYCEIAAAAEAMAEKEAAEAAEVAEKAMEEEGGGISTPSIGSRTSSMSTSPTPPLTKAKGIYSNGSLQPLSGALSLATIGGGGGGGYGRNGGSYDNRISYKKRKSTTRKSRKI